MKEKAFDTTTGLFREQSAIFTIVKRLLNEFPGDPRVACVGCSSGEEVYSLLAAHRLAKNGGAQLVVDGYDMNPRMIEIACEGQYIVRPYYPQFREALITRTFETQQGQSNFLRVSVPQALRAQAHFALWNIAEQPLPTQYPVILCANMLYHYVNGLKAHSIQEVLTNLVRSVAPGGYLVLESGTVNIHLGEGFTNKEYLETLRSNALLSDKGDKAIVFHRRNSNGIIQVDRAKIFQL